MMSARIPNASQLPSKKDLSVNKQKWMNRKPELPKKEPLTVTRLIRSKDLKNQNHPRLPSITLTNSADVEDVPLAAHLPKSDEDVIILPDISYSELRLIRDLPKESCQMWRKYNYPCRITKHGPWLRTIWYSGIEIHIEFLEIRKYIDWTSGETDQEGRGF